MYNVIPGAIIGDGDRKRALILLLGLSPWYGTIFLFLEQIAPSPVAHTRTCCEDFFLCHESEMTSVITEMFDTFGPPQLTTQYVHVCWNFASVFRRKLLQFEWSKRVLNLVMSCFIYHWPSYIPLLLLQELPDKLLRLFGLCNNSFSLTQQKHCIWR